MKWKIRSDSDPDKTDALAQALNIDQFIAQILVQRGVDTFEKAQQFFRPSLENLHDPFQMKDMNKAVSRLTDAIFSGETIMVYGDYDVDGTTAVTMMYSFLRKMDANAHFYIPHRYKEGYGLSEAGVRKAHELKCSLMITLDCGITAVDQVRLANELGMDVIICDHHKPGEQLPEACAVLDPQRNDCAYPFTGLSGCGVGFKLLQGFIAEQSMDFEVLEEYLDLLCISIGADIVPMVGENRVLAYFGLARIMHQPRLGVRALFNSAGFEKTQISISDVVFILAPRINAAGRIESAEPAVHLLLSEDHDEALKWAKQIEGSNTTRREQQTQIFEEAFQQYEEDPWLQDSWVTVVASEAWQKGVIGIVASKLMDHRYRPTIVFTESNGVFSGSARSIQGLDIYDCLSECSDLLIQFGGHSMAAGMTMEKENLHAFREKLDEAVRKRIHQDDLVRTIEIDRELDFRDINSSSYRIIRQLAPFGPGNMRPVFLTRDVVNARNTRTVGSDQSHLKLHVRQQHKPSPEFDGIGFGMGEKANSIVAGSPFDLVFSLEENEWRGNVTLQLSVKDLKFQDK